MKLRAICNNAECWQNGEVFEAHKYPDGSLYIYCNDPEAADSGHSLITLNGEDITEETLEQSDEFVLA